MITFFLRSLVVCWVICRPAEMFAQQPANSPEDAAASQTAPTRDKHRRDVANLIARRFPNLNENVLAGWVDAYADLPLEELDLLLQQKQMLPEILPSGLQKSRLAAERPGIFGSPPATEELELTIGLRRIHRQNLLHQNTPGHRRILPLTLLTHAAAQTGPTDVQVARTHFDFSPGPIVAVGNPLHLAIFNTPQAMFRLEIDLDEPRSLLTRCGTFVILADGRIGLQIADDSWPLFGAVRLPTSATRVAVTPQGQVSYRNDAGNTVQAGQVQLAVIDDLSLLSSRNGVFFELSPEQMERHVEMSTDVPLRPQSLELSNTDSDIEIQSLKRLAYASGEVAN